MELTFEQFESRLKGINRRFNANILLEKKHGKYTLYCCDDYGVIVLTLTISAELNYTKVYESLRLLGSLFI